MFATPKNFLMKVSEFSWMYIKNKQLTLKSLLLLLVGLLSFLSISFSSLVTLQSVMASVPSVEEEDIEQKKDVNGVIVLEGATLIDGNSNQPRNNSVVVLKGERIVTVTDMNKGYIYPKNSVIVNLTGRYIIPGIFDMHAHVASVLRSSYNQKVSQNMLESLLANGITTIRNPGGPTEQSVALRDAVSLGKIKGPQIFTAGRLINGPQYPTGFEEIIVKSENEVREEVKRQAEAGVDYIKLYVGLTPNLVHAAIDEAHTRGIRVIGHLFLTSWTDAAERFGIDALTHALPESSDLLSADKRERFLNVGGGPFDHFLWLDLVNLNGPEINDMISALVENKVAVDPTLVIFETMFSDEDTNKAKSLMTKTLYLIKMLYDRGVLITAGSDIPNFDLAPGISLHHELELLVKAGIPPVEVIRIATKNAAEALGILDDVGTIEPGKQADMIILNANPISNINNTIAINEVINDGQFLDSSNHSM